MGMNDTVVQKFASLGLEAAIIAIAATLGSVIGAKLLWKNLQPSHRGGLRNSFRKSTNNRSPMRDLRDLS